MKPNWNEKREITINLAENRELKALFMDNRNSSLSQIPMISPENLISSCSIMEFVRTNQLECTRGSGTASRQQVFDASVRPNIFPVNSINSIMPHCEPRLTLIYIKRAR